MTRKTMRSHKPELFSSYRHDMKKKNYAPSSRARFLLERLRHYAHRAIVPFIPQKELSMSQSPIDMLSIRESWRMFRILAEIVDGFETLSDLGPCVSIFGSARVKPENRCMPRARPSPSCWSSRVMASSPAAGPGLMEAGNKGATEPEERPSACISSFPTNKNAISM